VAEAAPVEAEARRSPHGGLRLSAGVCSLRTMKVLEGLRAIEPGTAVPVAKLGLPIGGEKGSLLVFWKST